jgi:NAD(P)-dependent dehydrogenase (short-subunit alcohol dehydrogenase family)
MAVAASSSQGESSLRHRLRVPAECDRVSAAALERFAGLHLLVNNAGLTFATIDPARFRRAEPQKFWQVPDDIVRAVIETNYIAAHRMARRVAPVMVEQGWGRIVNVTTKLDTMNRQHTSPYGASKAALEMATEVWAKEVEGTGLTVNIVNPGPGANTPGMADEMRAMSREGRARTWSSPTRWPRRSSTSSRPRPTPSTAGASTPTSGTCHSRPPKPPAAPASNCAHSRVDQEVHANRGTFAATLFIAATAANCFYAGMDKGAGGKPRSVSPPVTSSAGVSRSACSHAQRDRNASTSRRVCGEVENTAQSL